jgi:hypothetical protein
MFKINISNIKNSVKHLRYPQATVTELQVQMRIVQFHKPARCFGRNCYQQNYHNIVRKFEIKPNKNFIQYDKCLITLQL